MQYSLILKEQQTSKGMGNEGISNEVMAFTHKQLDSLNVSSFIKCLIGWQKEMDENSRRMLLSKKIKIWKY